MTPSGLARTALAGAVVYGLLLAANTSDVLSELTRPLVVFLLQQLGVDAFDARGGLVIGQLQIPWTRDCAGLNTIGVLVAVAFWTSRHEPWSFRAVGRLALAVPAGLLANFARILTLIVYRWAFFPVVESPQLHYFMGFVWVLPFLTLFAPPRRDAAGPGWLEALYVAAVLALLSPYVSAPGGGLVAIAALLVLAENRLRLAGRAVSALQGGLWLVSGLFIAVARMESLWIPWLLCSPWFVSPSIVRSPGGLALVIGTIPLVAMHPVGQVVILAGAGWQAWCLATRPAIAVPSPSVAQSRSRTPVALATAGLPCLVVLPLLASSVALSPRTSERPPGGVMSRAVDDSTYRVRLVGQPPGIDLDWFASNGDGRHHTLPVCMRYRGVLVHESAHAGVYTDGTRWMREFFLHRGDLLLDYPMYLRRTFSPFAPPGVHLIASAPVGSMSARSFALAAERLAREVRRVSNGDVMAATRLGD